MLGPERMGREVVPIEDASTLDAESECVPHVGLKPVGSMPFKTDRGAVGRLLPLDVCLL